MTCSLLVAAGATPARADMSTPAGAEAALHRAAVTEYQNRLARVNVNARTAVPTHAMGLAVDISTRQTLLRTVWEIRDVLRRMAADGQLLFPAERRPLVFHVVPTPRQRAYFAATGEGLITVPPVRLAPWRWSPAAQSTPPSLAASHPATGSLLASSAIALPVLVLLKADVRRWWRGRAARRTAPAHVEGLR